MVMVGATVSFEDFADVVVEVMLKWTGHGLLRNMQVLVCTVS